MGTLRKQATRPRRSARHRRIPAGLTWERDVVHMPFALTPLAADYVRIMGDGFAGWPSRYSGVGFGDFEQAAWYEVWDGYAYIGHRPEALDDDLDRMKALGRARAEVTADYWRDEVIPELLGLYEQIDAAVIETGPGDVAAADWDMAWHAFRRTQELHFDATLGVIAVLTDLDHQYRSIVPIATIIDAERLIYGFAHEVIRAELALERVVELARESPNVVAALRTGTDSPEDLRQLPGGETVATAFEAYLGEHGHLGQSADDLSLASWSEAPDRLVREIAKRIDLPPGTTIDQLERRDREARELANAAREALRDDPERLARFERTLAVAREIGPIGQSHNYWIDRRVQAHMRRLAFRAGRRLVADHAFDEPGDVLYLRRDEVRTLLTEPRDVRRLVQRRRRRHARQLETQPPPSRGVAPEDRSATSEPDVDDQAADVGLLHGTGASAGIARGPARVTRSSDEFDRILPGDVIVCPTSNPSWVPVFSIAAGLVTEVGGVLAHAAVVARELGVPAVVAVRQAMTLIPDGAMVEIDGRLGTVRLLEPDGGDRTASTPRPPALI